MLSLCLQICLLCSQKVLLVLIDIKVIYKSSQVYISIRKKRSITVASSLDLKCRKKKRALFKKLLGKKNAEWDKLNNGYSTKVLHGRKGKKNMGKKEIKKEFRIVMPHFHKIIVYSKSAYMCFPQGHIQTHRKMSKHHILRAFLHSSTVFWTPLWDLRYEPALNQMLY